MEEITNFKHDSELDFWEGVVDREGTFKNDFYKEYYTKHFEFNEDDYKDKTILDIGCGPRGSLEWAKMCKTRIGIDPLIHDYYKLNGGTLQHEMKYVCANSENMPFPDETFDYIFSLNSLDHVDDLDETIAEIKRVLKIGGLFSCLVDANHDPTPCEPISIDFNLKEKFFPEFELVTEKAYESVHHGMRQNLNEELYYDWDNPTKRGAILFIKLKKVKNPKTTENMDNSNFKETQKKFNVTFEELMNNYLKLEEENKNLKELVNKYENRKSVKLANKLKKGL